jgi:hypothetical protein
MPFSFGWSFQLNCIFILLLLITYCPVQAVRLSGTILKQNPGLDNLNGEFGWQFLGRFAFDNTGKARFNGVLNVGGSGGKTSDSGVRHFLAFYRDGDGSGGWPSVYAAEFSCMNKVAFSRFRATLALDSATVYDFTVTSATRASYWCSPSIAR